MDFLKNAMDSQAKVSARWILFIAWGAAIVWLSLTPSPPEIDVGFLGWDKFQHAAAYGLFTFLAGRAFVVFSFSAEKRRLLAVFAALLLGGALEVAQGLFTQARAAEFGDLAADLVGAGLVYFYFKGKKSHEY